MASYDMFCVPPTKILRRDAQVSWWDALAQSTPIGISGVVLWVLVGVLFGLLQVLMPTWTQHLATHVAGGGRDWTIGHFSSLSYVAGATTWWVFLFTQSLTFSAGVAVVIYGVRVILGEIVPSFSGIATKLVPDARPALDIPVAFPFGANSVLIGFLSSFVAGIVMLLIMGPIGLAAIVPGLLPHFFVGGGAGVIGNAFGGQRGAVIGGLVNGVIISLGAALLLPALGGLGFQNTTYGDADFQWVGIVWEPMLSAAHYKLDNLIAVIDRNHLTQEGYTERTMALEPLAEKRRSFGWQTLEVDGHDVLALLEAFQAPRDGRPKMLIATTQKAHGVPAYQDLIISHFAHLTSDQASAALALIQLERQQIREG
jgi:hypothetical protein